MRAAPAILAPWMAAMPTPPHPKTTTFEPGWTFAVLMAAPTPVVTPQPMSEAISNGTSASILTAPSTGIVRYSANVPVPAMPRSGSPLRVKRGWNAEPNWISVHRWGDLRPVQLMQRPHGGDQATITWSPSATVSTPSPTAEMIPAPSCPRTHGAARGQRAVHGRQVGVAHAGGLDLDRDLARTGWQRLDVVDDLELLVAGVEQNRSTHGCPLMSVLG